MTTVYELKRWLDDFPGDYEVLLGTESFARYMDVQVVSQHDKDQKIVIAGMLWMGDK